MAARADVDPAAIALCGSSLGGGVAVQAAGLDPRVSAVIVENGVANGERMIRSMHSAESWAKFRALLDDIAAHRERTGTTKMIHRFDIFEMPKALQVNLTSNGSLMQFTGETAIGFFMFRPEEFVARIAVTNQRMAVASMEPRGATARYDAATDSYTLRVCSQGTTAMRDPIAVIMQIPKERLRVLTDDVGGAFGLKTGPYPEYIVQLVAAKKLGRPVHWMSGRSEAFLSDNQARDLYSEAELALDDNGRFLALRIRNTANLGAYVGAVGANIPTLNFARCLPALYDIKHIDINARCAMTAPSVACLRISRAAVASCSMISVSRATLN